MINRILKHGCFAGLVVLCLLFIARWSMQPHTVANFPKTLLPTEQERVIVGPHEVIHMTAQSTTKQYLPSMGSVTVSVDKTGKVVTHVKTTGVGVRPGFSVLYADQVRLGLDVQVAYLGRMGLHVGCAFGDRPVVLPFVAGSYRLDQVKLPNTSIMAGKTLGNPAWVVGLRWEF